MNTTVRIERGYGLRPVIPVGITRVHGWSFKQYAIAMSVAELPTGEEWNQAKPVLETIVARFRDSTCDLKFGYLILHKGYDSTYFVVSSWACDNMLRMFAFSSPIDELKLRPVESGLNICVWDMLIHKHERDAFVDLVLSNPDAPQVQRYMESFFEQRHD